jgi:enoyl-CoA hydratase/carnithine racemase
VSDGTVRIERPESGVAVVTLDRVDQHNALTMALQQELGAALDALARDADVGCVVLTGAGERAFSSGYDLKEMADWDADALLASIVDREALLGAVATCDVPIVAALNGLAYGAGAIIASAVDVRIGCPQTSVRFTAGAYGGANATWSLPSIVGRGIAGELLMTARPVGADEALRIGLLNRVVDQDDLLGAAVDTAALIAANPPAGVRAIKRLLREHEGRTAVEAFEAENLLMRTTLRPKPIREVFASSDIVE